MSKPQHAKVSSLGIKAYNHTEEVHREFSASVRDSC